MVKPDRGKLVENISCADCSKEEAEYVQENMKVLEDILKQEVGVGLAAPQLGINKKFFLIVREDHKRLYFNASYLSVTEERDIVTNEGCLSYKDSKGKCIRTEVNRFSEILVNYEYFDEEGKWIKVENERHKDSNLGIIIQHETDHLYGLTIFFQDEKN